MTTTQLTIGLGGSEKVSSRVLKPPGGGSSNIFGPADDEPAPVRVDRRGASTLVLGDEPAPTAPPADADQAPAEPAEQENGAVPEAEEPEADPASAGDAAATEQPAAEPQKPRRQPPGGYSTPLW